MNTQTQEALKMAIECLQLVEEYDDYGINVAKPTIQACKEALAQPTMTYEQGFAHGYEAHRVEQELEQPAQDFFERGKEIAKWADKQNEQPAQEPIHNCPNCNSLFTKEIYSIPAPSWQGLSDDEIDKIYFKTFDTWSSEVDVEFAHAISQALKEKNHD